MYKGAISVEEFEVLISSAVDTMEGSALIVEVSDLLRRVNLGLNQNAIKNAATQSLVASNDEESKMLTWEPPVKPKTDVLNRAVGGLLGVPPEQLKHDLPVKNGGTTELPESHTIGVASDRMPWDNDPGAPYGRDSMGQPKYGDSVGRSEAF